MILPIECDDAVDRLNDAVLALAETGAPQFVIDAFVDALQQTRGAVLMCSTRQRMEDVEERHVECQTFPWADEP